MVLARYQVKGTSVDSKRSTDIPVCMRLAPTPIASQAYRDMEHFQLKLFAPPPHKSNDKLIS